MERGVRLETVSEGKGEIDHHDLLGSRQMTCWSRYFGHWWTWAYLLDWFLLISCTLTELAIMNLAVQPPDRYLPVNDPSVNYPYESDIYPSWALIFPILLGIAVFAAFQIVMQSAHDFHHALLGFTEALLITLIFTDVTKVVAGRYRPDWAGRAGESSAVIRDGRQSFPSGHSSISFAAMVYLSLYLAGKVGLFRDNGGAVWKAFLCIMPTGFSTAIALTRVRDYHHHFSDILAGSILGTALAIFAYCLNYHSLFGDNSHIPKKRTNEKPVYYSIRFEQLEPVEV